MSSRTDPITGFSPTPAMRRYAKACAAHDVPPDEDSRIRAAQVSRRSLAQWRADLRFMAWLQEEVQRILLNNAWEVLAVVNRLAREGNLQAAKLLLDRLAPAAPDAVAPETFRHLADLAQLPENAPEPPSDAQ